MSAMSIEQPGRRQGKTQDSLMYGCPHCRAQLLTDPVIENLDQMHAVTCGQCNNHHTYQFSCNAGGAAVFIVRFQKENNNANIQ